MKGRLKACILNNSESLNVFRCAKADKFYWLLLLSSASVFLDFSSVVAITAPQKVAQQGNVRNNINRPTLKVGSQGESVSELQAALKLLGFYSGTVDGNYSNNTATAVSRFKQAVGLNPDGVVDATTWQRLFPREPVVGQTTSLPNSTAGFPVPTLPATNPTTQPRPTNPRPTTPQVVNTRPEPRPINRRPVTTPTRQTTPRRPSSPAQQISGVQYTSGGWPILRVGMSNSEVTRLQTRLKQLGFLTGGVDGYFGAVTETAVKAAQKRYGIEPDGVVGGATWEAILRRSPQQR